MTEYIDKPDKAIFLCYLNGQCAGRIVLHEAWNRYAFIEDLDVKRAFRRQGVGTALMERAKRWARERGLGGLALETQDTNLIACRFYQKCGLEIGAVNTMLYKNMPAPACEDIAYLCISNLGNGRKSLRRGKWDFMQGQCQWALLMAKGDKPSVSFADSEGGNPSVG